MHTEVYVWPLCIVKLQMVRTNRTVFPCSVAHKETSMKGTVDKLKSDKVFYFLMEESQNHFIALSTLLH